ncbi:MAG TPA: hypothetical protein VLF18_19865, partial [Tahibacter sp.]|uniref:hypothetical protein n=1 Tax=Tahibacter sp. TaxID=2056211 RepID=UPI002BBA50B6
MKLDADGTHLLIASRDRSFRRGRRQHLVRRRIPARQDRGLPVRERVRAALIDRETDLAESAAFWSR